MLRPTRAPWPLLHLLLFACGTSGSPGGGPRPGEGDPEPPDGPGTSTAPRPTETPVTAGSGAAAPRCAASCQLDSDEALIAHHRAQTGEEVKGCVKRSRVFPGAVVVGSFAHDRGCMAHGVYVGCCYHEGVTTSAGPVLAAAGWGAAAAPRREELALLWLKDIYFAFGGSLLETPGEDFARAGQAFAPPAVATGADGVVTVRGWMLHPSGMLPESRYSLVEHRLAPDGRHLSGREVTTFRQRM